MKLLIILSQKPYGSDVTWNALRLAETSLKRGDSVSIFVMNDAVDIARKGSAPAGTEFDLGLMLEQLESKGCEIKLCTTCITRCGISKGDVRQAAWPAGMGDLAGWMAGCDKVVTF